MSVTTTPNRAPPETTKELTARLAKQKIGSTEGIHPKTLVAQKAREKLGRIVKKRKATS